MRSSPSSFFSSTLAWRSVVALLVSAWIEAAYAQSVAPEPRHLLDRRLLQADPDDGVLRVRLDARRARLWVLDVGRVHVIDLVTNRRIRTVELPNWMFSTHEDMCLPDLAIDEDGAAFVSDNMQPKLWRIAPADFSIRERVVSRDAYRELDAGFTALAIGEGGVMFAAMSAPGLLWRIDTDLFRAENVPLATRIPGVCGLEVARGARSRDITLYALGGRDRHTVSRITLARGGTAAVTPIRQTRTGGIDLKAVGSPGAAR
ncbi:MAG TPA: hypothetical protein VHP37_22150 [Burkholderiales bacterium]|nr:hypothetical protein [Burkholderiales bacterium]